MTEEMSEFGKGFAYCLGLFLAHAERDMSSCKKMNDYSIWFNAAGDHLFDLCTDEKVLGTWELAEKAKSFRKYVLDRRILFDDSIEPTIEDVKWAVQQAKNLLLEWDRAKGIDCQRGTWE